MRHLPVTNQKGQIALIALLVLTIAVTVGLSLVARSTTNVAVTRDMEESTRAFSAAEAGVEESLKSGLSGSAVMDASFGVSYTTTIASVSGAANAPFTFPRKTPRGETETLWLVNHKEGGVVDDSTPLYTSPSIIICWDGTPKPALIATLLYKRSSDGAYVVGKAALDADSVRAGTNKFTALASPVPACGTLSMPYVSSVTFASMSPGINPATDVLIALRIRPVYSDAQIAVVPSQNLPYQVNHIQSVGQTQSGVNRKIEVFQQYRSPSSIFDAAVYSEDSFAH